MSPKLVPAGVFTGLVVPLNVIVVVPLTLLKFTTLVPLILNTPVVEKVTGSAFACDIPSSPIPTNNAPITVAFKKRFILAPPMFSVFLPLLVFPLHTSRPAPRLETNQVARRLGGLPAFLHTSGQTDVKTRCIISSCAGANQ